MNLLEIPFEEFPLNHTRYNYIMDELRSAARGFEQLHWLGWSNGKELDSRLMKIHADLNAVWKLIQETERQLAASIASKR
ncbi:hypothetical protein KHQ08_12665 [Pseudochrobactrum algeriensis]|uniref:hypothetical protein n=1 Tax=Pseudochrobactrum algeriensis TaxID=2834768 RepID=UPI001BD06713|nr:hypothetical protein [Pseudochrobactrum algeriensis]QVQ36030.1 hypothetical protein KHQ08_12665 [Pseudochrobactrum algeriensis]QVQ39247.1 hypothetical protein KHQ07_10950 [Pseudochrobactrum algeriensis]QVQ43167.1 hypothetical protein KHQ09_12910 [Pseudochrobactrum algeriensis]